MGCVCVPSEPASFKSGLAASPNGLGLSPLELELLLDDEPASAGLGVAGISGAVALPEPSPGNGNLFAVSAGWLAEAGAFGALGAPIPGALFALGSPGNGNLSAALGALWEPAGLGVVPQGSGSGITEHGFGSGAAGFVPLLCAPAMPAVAHKRHTIPYANIEPAFRRQTIILSLDAPHRALCHPFLTMRDRSHHAPSPRCACRTARSIPQRAAAHPLARPQ